VVVYLGRVARQDDNAPRYRRHEPAWLRWVAAAFLACVAVAFAFPAYGALSNLWADYQDSPAWVYVLFGGVSAVVSVASLVGVALLLRRRS
jgi:hypothetical protein